jgi:hypothetical protein
MQTNLVLAAETLHTLVCNVCRLSCCNITLYDTYWHVTTTSQLLHPLPRYDNSYDLSKESLVRLDPANKRTKQQPQHQQQQAEIEEIALKKYPLRSVLPEADYTKGADNIFIREDEVSSININYLQFIIWHKSLWRPYAVLVRCSLLVAICNYGSSSTGVAVFI